MPDRPLHSGHRERLRQKLMKYDADTLCEHELLELLLCYALPRVNTNETAHLLLNRFGTISGVLCAPKHELTQIKGIGASSADFLHFINSLCSEYFLSSPEQTRLSDIESSCAYLEDYFRGAPSGLCLLLCLGNGSELTGRMCFTIESLLSGGDEVRRILSKLMLNGCGRVILGISRSGSLPVPEGEDYSAVKILSEKLSPLGIILTDCIICANDRSFSMKQRGAFSFGV